MQVRKTKFCWHCSRMLWGWGLYFATMFIDGAPRMLHKECKKEIEEYPFSFGYDYETGREDMIETDIIEVGRELSKEEINKLYNEGTGR